MKITKRKKGINLKAPYLQATKHELMKMTKEQYEKELMPIEFQYGHSKFYISGKTSKKLCGYVVKWDREYMLRFDDLKIYIGLDCISIYPNY